MVEFVSDSSTNDQKSKEPLDSLDSKSNDYSFADSFLDYDSIEDWIEELTIPVMTDSESLVVEVDGIKSVDSSVEVQLSNRSELGSELTVEKSVSIVGKVEPIEEGMSKVSLVAEAGSLVLDGGNTVKSEVECCEDGSESDVESENTNSSNSSSSSSDSSSESDDEEILLSSSSGNSGADDDEKNEVVVNVERGGETGDLEEGEIRDVDVAEVTNGIDNDNEHDDEEVSAEHMVTWDGDGECDVEDEDGDEDNEEAEVKGGPICSENELKVLPPVPQVYATLQPHHQMLPVGAVLSIIKNQVIVEGVEKHNPLSEGSVLWITESRSPLGFVDEIFGPVKNPYYSVRYNSESEVPTGIHGGAQISFVSEFVNYVLNNKDLYKKGYDASGVNDEEVTDEEEFSDDEKELEFKRMHRLAKREMNDQKDGNRNNSRKKNTQSRKFGQHSSQHARMPETSRNGQPTAQRTKMPEPCKLGRPPFQQANMNTVQPSSNQNQHMVSPLASFVEPGGGRPNSSAAGQCFINGTGVNPSFPPMYNPCFTPTLNGIGPTYMPFQQQPNMLFQQQQQQQPNMLFQQQQQQQPPNMLFQQQNPFFPNTFPMNGMPWLLPNPAQQSPQMPMMNTFTGLAYPQGLMGTTLPSLPNPFTSAGEQGIQPGGLQFGQNHNLHPPLSVPGNMEATQQFNPGNSNSHPPTELPGNVTAAQQFNPGNSHPPAESPGSVAAAQQFSPGTSSKQGRKPHNRGGAHFRGRRGWGQRR